MNSEVLIWSDVHVHPHKKSSSRLDDCLKVVNWVFDLADERGITSILFGGDLIHERTKVDVYTYQRLFELLKSRLILNKYQLYLLLGNHDLWFNEKTSVSSVVPLSALPGVTIIDKPSRLKIAGSDWDFIPFTHNPVAAVEELKKNHGSFEYALGHISLSGAYLHGNTYADIVVEHEGDMVQVDANIFDHYKRVFLGHFHCQQKVNDTVEYIGSPLQLSFGEAFQKKHVIVFDCASNTAEYVENTFSPTHLIVKQEELHKQDLTGKFVEVIVEDVGTVNLLDMRKELMENHRVGELRIKPKKKKVEEHVITSAKAILYQGDAMLAHYVDEVGTEGLDRDTLLKVGRELCQQKITE